MNTEICLKIRKPFPVSELRRVVKLLMKEFRNHPRLKKAVRDSQNDCLLRIVIVGRTLGLRLNAKFRGKNYPTDVLSFPVDTSHEGLGEIVLCAPVLVSQARRHELRLEQEVAYMLIHGFMHLLGFDHEKSQRNAKKMFKIQDRLFEKWCIKRR
ncbi:MAG: rRNA maturation RNase YbeY [Oligoflexia bacterium]|nr:rRNA maturation RNase YbeY [Oligoflexia bacterium]